MSIPKGAPPITKWESYRWLAIDIIGPVIEAINAGQNVEYNLGILMSDRNRKWFQALGWNPEDVIGRVLARNGIEIVRNGNDS